MNIKQNYSLLILLLIVISFINCGSAAKSHIISHSCTPDFVYSNETFDLCYSVVILVENVGASGNISFAVKLSCSEGKFVRNHNMYLNQDEQRELKFRFHEPTINATNIAYEIIARPSTQGIVAGYYKSE